MTTTQARQDAADAPGDRPREADRRTGLWGAAAGLVAGGLTIAVADLLAAALGLQTTPVVAVGAVFVENTPGWLKDLAIARFGTHDKQVLLTGMGVTIALLSMLAGRLMLRHLRAALASVVALDLVALAATVTRPGTSRVAALPVVVGAVCGLATFVVLARLVRRARTPWATVGRPAAGRATRRRLVLGLLAGTGAAVAAQAAAHALTGRPQGAGPAAVQLPRAAVPAPVLPAGTVLDVPGISAFTTTNRDFYRIDTALVVPRVDADTWSLRVHGMVNREITLDYAGLLALPLVERTITMTCVSNEVGGTLAGNATWLGYPLAALLAQAGPSPDADMVLSASGDGFTVSTPLAALTDGRDALLAVGMNGVPLPAEHGFPARMVVPGLYGYVSATKWVVDLLVTRFDKDSAYWTRRGYAAKAPIRTASRIDVPKPFARIPAGRVAVAGVAWAQHRGIGAVQVRVDGGPWQAARLAGDDSDALVLRDMWRQWVWTWDAAPGLHLLEVRATDGDGQTQPAQRRRPAPDGATGWHSVSVTVT